VAITDEGRRALAAALPGHRRQVRRLMLDRLSRQQLDQLAEISERVLDGLRDG
jgi:DNA-binding MarR family transcriptional regulator